MNMLTDVQYIIIEIYIYMAQEMKKASTEIEKQTNDVIELASKISTNLNNKDQVKLAEKMSQMKENFSRFVSTELSHNI